CPDEGLVCTRTVVSPLPLLASGVLLRCCRELQCHRQSVEILPLDTLFASSYQRHSADTGLLVADLSPLPEGCRFFFPLSDRLGVALLLRANVGYTALPISPDSD